MMHSYCKKNCQIQKIVFFPQELDQNRYCQVCSLVGAVIFLTNEIRRLTSLYYILHKMQASQIGFAAYIWEIPLLL